LASVCVRCPEGCVGCSSSSVCISCMTGYLLNKDKLCRRQCSERTYADTLTLTCLDCPFDCLTCSSLGQCLSCSPSDFRELDNSTSRCIPLTGYFESFVSESGKCAGGCGRCLNSTVCYSCLFGFALSNDLCSSECPFRYYKDTNTSACRQCPFDCFLCKPTG
jgi:hypothetical protein